jgi:hypothetical protein
LLIACLILVAGDQLRFGHGSTSLLELGPFTLDLGIPSEVVVLVFALWYFYVKANVRSYYRGLKNSNSAVVGNKMSPNAGPQADA